MDIQQIVEKFKSKPYLMSMGKGSLSKIFKCSEDDIKTVKKIIRSGKNQFNEYCEINGVDPNNVNHYWHKGTHYSLHVDNQQLSPEIQFKTLLDECKLIAPKYNNFIKVKKLDQTCAVINIYDIHLDKRDIRSDNKNQLEKISEEIINGFSDLLSSINTNNPSTYIMPVGNDIFCTNGFDKSTKKGTPQDPIVPHEIVFREGLSLIRAMIDELSKYGDVYIPIIYGNHDADAVWYLGVALEVLYENNDHVIINNDKLSRKYHKFGDNLFGFGHGDLEKRNIDKLPLIMATTEPKLWADTKYRIFYLGDIHHKQEFKFFRTKDNPGCTVQFLRSISVTDQWHDDNMFVGIPRTMEATVFDKNRGQIANYSLNI